MLRVRIFILVAVGGWILSCTHAFSPTLAVSSSPKLLSSSSSSSRFLGSQFKRMPSSSLSKKKQSFSTSSKTKSSLNMFLGNDGGILGVGTPEVFTILLVGYFILGPSDLYKLVKEIGKFIQNIRTLGSDVTKTFESSMETQLELDEIRKAQRELNDAFSFRRSINVDADSEVPFGDTVTSTRPGQEPMIAETIATGTTAASAAATGKRKKIRRRKKKILQQDEDEAMMMMTNGGAIPDLDMTAAFPDEMTTAAASPPSSMSSDTWEKLANNDGSTTSLVPEKNDETERLRVERMERLMSGQQDNQDEDNASPEENDATIMTTNAEANRFAAQLSGNWNDSILKNEDKLSPLAQVMEQLALLEEEKKAADARILEQFQLRTDLEEAYYNEKRRALEEAAALIQAEAYYIDPTPPTTEQDNMIF